MDMLFLDSPILPIKNILKENNIIPIKFDRSNPNTIQAIYTHMTKIDKKLYPNLKYILCPMTGIYHLNQFDNGKYDIFYLNDKQWLYDNVWSTAEHTLTLIMRLVRGLSREVHKKTIGIVGFGRVGQQLYTLLQGFMPKKILWYDTQEVYYDDYIDNADRVDQLTDIFKYSDIVSIHLAETALTKNIINEDCFKACERQPILINTARVSLIHYGHMMEAFNEGKISGFGLDIDIDYFDKYHTKAWEEMKNLDKLFRGAIVTPHVAGKSIESRIITDRFVFNQFFKKLGGKTYEDDIG